MQAEARGPVSSMDAVPRWSSRLMSSAKRVLVTRAARQSSELAERLRVLGAEPVLVPVIETVEPSSFAALDAALTQLDGFHWVLFTSANAAEAVRSRVGDEPIRVAGKVAAIGPATAKALQSLGLHPDLMPAQAVAESFAEALLPHAHQPDGAPTRFLLIRAEEARDLLVEELRDAGAEVTVAPAYRTVIPAGSENLVRGLFGPSLSQPPIEAVTFTSSSAARNLLALCESAGVALPPAPKRVSIGPITSQTLRELGLPPHAEAAEATVASLAEAVMRALAGRERP